MYTIPFHTTSWKDIPETMHAGESGVAYWRTQSYGDLRIRLVRYSENYKADHWCTLGHILFCTEGELDTELQDGHSVRLTAGMSYQVSDGLSAHRSSTKKGATLFIIDGGFLRGEEKPA